MADPILRAADIATLLKNLAVDVREFVRGELAPLSEKNAKLAETLDSLATVCEVLPERLEVVERRLRELEARHGR